MNLFSLLAQRAPNKVFASIVVGIVSGVVYSLLIPLVAVALRGIEGSDASTSLRQSILGVEVTQPAMALTYLLAIAFVWTTRTWVDLTMTGVSTAVASDLRVQLYRRITQAPLAAIERIGLPRLMTAISTDMPAIVKGAQTAQTMMVDMMTLVGMLGFLAYVHLGVFWLVLKCIVLGVLSYQLIFVSAGRFFVLAARVNDELQQSVQGLLEGFKELKLSDEKRHQYFETILVANERELIRVERPGNVIHSSAANYGLMLNFLFLGGIAFVFVSYHALSMQSMSSVMMVMLYISMPIGSVTSKIPGFVHAKVAMGRIRRLMDELPKESAAEEPAPAHPWTSIRFEQVAYEHAARDEGAGFVVGPVDLEIRKGEITFIVGGNGSGKSTLSKLLTLHYRPTQGAIRFDEVRITDDNVNAYRQHVSAIYSDYYLFDRILTSDCDQQLVDHYLHALGLAGKVVYRDGRFSTLALSDGQRRRMALLAAFVEDRDLLLFDEWAADQDPNFKEVFYRQILPSLKARGKAVVVISHDDRFFDVADMLVGMSEGRVARVSTGADADGFRAVARVFDAETMPWRGAPTGVRSLMKEEGNV